MKLVIFTIFATFSVERADAADCVTPNGDRGVCVSIYKCPHISALLELPKPPIANIEYVKKLKCNSPTPYSVCCGPDKGGPSGVIVGDCQRRMFLQPPDPRSTCCGLKASEPRPYFSSAVLIDQYPWLAVIQYDTVNGTRVFCGGSLISSRYILTAAHCVSGPILQMGRPTKVYLGEYNTTNDGPDCVQTEAGGLDCTDPVTVIPIDRTIVHPSYDKTTNKTDIALIRLKTWAPFTDFIRPICLPSTNVGLTQETSVFTAGWGANITDRDITSTVIQESNLRYVKQETCQSVFKAAELPTNQWDKLICVSGENTKHACTGDSGGPLLAKPVYNNIPTRHTEIVGVESFSRCISENVARVYTKVFEHKDWIRNTIENTESVINNEKLHTKEMKLTKE